MSKTNPTCRRCNVELDDDNWYPSFQKRAPPNYRSSNHVCKSCYITLRRERRQANKEQARLESEKDRRRRGVKSMQDNKMCPKWLGVHIAEQVLQRVFKNVTPMPHDNSGFDFICGRGYKVDVKSSCIRYCKNASDSWKFHIFNNQTADYFLCLAFDNRADLTPMHLWLLPGDYVNQKKLVSISTTTIDKWNDYKLDINKVVSCCNIMKKE